MPAAKVEKKLDPTEIFKPWLDITQAKAFLSSEFLLWLWHLAESPANPLQLHLPLLGQTVLAKIWVEDRLVLESQDSRAHIHTLKGGEPSRSLEAESALQTGKQVKELRLGLHLDPYGDFLVLLASKDLSPKAIVLPTGVEASEGRKNRVDLALRLKMTDLLVDSLDSLFGLFLEQRTEPLIWDKTRKALDLWITNRGHAETHLH